MGHVLERHSGNVASVLRGPDQGAHRMFFKENATNGAPPAQADPWHGAGGDPWGQSASSHAPAAMPNNAYLTNTPPTSSWGNYQPTTNWNNAPQHGYNAIPLSVYMGVDDESDNATDTDTISSLGDGLYELPSSNNAEQAAEIFWNYQNSKSKWRSYMKKPTRRVRRVVRRFGKSKGKGRLWTFKGKGKGPTIQSFITDYEQAGQLSHLFYGGKGKGSSKGKRSSGFGKGRQGNPTGPDGNKLKCFNCGSEDHFQRDCTSSQMAF